MNGIAGKHNFSGPGKKPGHVAIDRCRGRRCRDLACPTLVRRERLRNPAYRAAHNVAQQRPTKKFSSLSGIQEEPRRARVVKGKRRRQHAFKKLSPKRHARVRPRDVVSNARPRVGSSCQLGSSPRLSLRCTFGASRRPRTTAARTWVVKPIPAGRCSRITSRWRVVRRPLLGAGAWNKSIAVLVSSCPGAAARARAARAPRRTRRGALLRAAGGCGQLRLRRSCTARFSR